MRARLMIMVVLASPALALAQVPPELAYQGRLLNADGSPVSGTQAMVFAIYDQPTGGTKLWTENEAVAVDDGFYSVVLGDQVPIPSSVFTGGERYLELTVAGSTLSPRQRIDSVAYALLSQGLAGATSCTRGQVPKWTASGWSCGDDLASSGTVTQVTGAAPLSVANGTTTPAISLGKAGTSSDGYLSQSDWNTFNGKQNAIQSSCTAGQYIQGINADGTVVCGVDASNAGTVTQVSASAPLSVANPTSTPALTLSKADTSTDGYLSASDWNRFNAAASSTLPSGMVMFYDGTSCPTGWTELSAARGRYLVGLNPGGNLGSVVGTALSDGENRPTGEHSHDITDPGHSHTFAITTSSASSGVWVLNNGTAAARTATSWATTDVDKTGITVDGVSGGAVAGTNAPYLQLLVCKKL